MVCPSCQEKLPCLTSVYNPDRERRPKEGDLGLCLSCGARLVFGADGGARVMTEADRRAAFCADPEALAYLDKAAASLPTFKAQKKGRRC